MRVRPRLRNDEGGFVLILVLFVMAALTVTVSGAVLVTQSDHATARASVDANRTLHLAQAGLMLFVSDRGASRVDSLVYDMGGGRVVVRARRISTTGLEEVHEISARATVRSQRGQYEMREVRQLAVLELRPFNPPGGYSTTSRNLSVNGTFSGTDLSTNGQCAELARGNRTGLIGVAGGLQDINSATLQGQPRYEFEADTAALRNRASTEWNELLDPGTPFDYEVPAVAWPAFMSLSASTYPTIRVRGDFTGDAAKSGRGLLVVEGRVNFGTDFVWDGVILAGDVVYPQQTNVVVRGTVITGLNANASISTTIGPNARGVPRFGYDACKVLWSSRGIARFRMLPNTWWEPGQSL